MTFLKFILALSDTEDSPADPKAQEAIAEAAERQLASMKNIRYKAAVHHNNFDQLLDDCYLLRVKVLKGMPESTRISGMLNKYPCWRKDPVLVSYHLYTSHNRCRSGILKIPRKRESGEVTLHMLFYNRSVISVQYETKIQNTE